MNRIWIFGGGTIDIDYVSKYMREHNEMNSIIIAADKGLEAVSKISLHPDIILGDLIKVFMNSIYVITVF